MDKRIGLNVVEEELEVCTKFCRDRDFGIEVTAFAYPDTLDHRYEEAIEQHTKVVNGLKWISLHGPFLDLFVTSPDPAIVEVCKQRHTAALNAAKEINAEIYVAHLNSLPMINNEAYRKNFVTKSIEFWLPFADEAGKHDITIVLENMWELGPELQKKFVQEANHPFLKASFDSGHARVFSKISASGWVEALGEDIAHFHLHDNDGEYDHHWPIGDGKEDWENLLKAINNHSIDEAAIVLESDDLNANKRSLKKLQRLLTNAE